MHEAKYSRLRVALSILHLKHLSSGSEQDGSEYGQTGQIFFRVMHLFEKSCMHTKEIAKFACTCKLRVIAFFHVHAKFQNAVMKV